MSSDPKGNRARVTRSQTAVSAPPRVAVLVESSRAFGRGILHALAERLQTRRQWTVYFQEGGLGEMLPGWFETWKGDGIIARIEDRHMARAIARKGIPVVDLRGTCPPARVPVVKTDNEEISRLAAEHLIERGFKRFAFCGYDGAEYSTQRGAAFAESVRRAGHTCRTFHEQGASRRAIRQQEQYGWSHEEHLVEWLRRLPKPIGILACNDARGHQLLNACRQHRIAVPDEVAVIGVDNYELVCELAEPPLSSVEQNTAKIASEAVRLLDRMMAGRSVPHAPILVKPCRVVARRSTDVLAIEDAHLRAAVRVIRSRGLARVGVDEIARAAGLSRRVFERRFFAAFGRSPGQEVLHVQLQAVKSLLLETDLPLYRIAEKAGFAHPEYLNVVFKRVTGITPRQWRLQMAG